MSLEEDPEAYEQFLDRMLSWPAIVAVTIVATTLLGVVSEWPAIWDAVAALFL
jgi:hypothetical protein